MAIIQTTTKVLLPKWLLRMQSTVPEREFNYEVLKYLKRYKDYQLDEVDGHFAICIRTNEIETKRRKKRG
jgi:hypothetical protein